jgi:hypothetical protein
MKLAGYKVFDLSGARGIDKGKATDMRINWRGALRASSLVDLSNDKGEGEG